MVSTVTLPPAVAVGSVSIATRPVAPPLTESPAAPEHEKQALTQTCQIMQHAADQLSETCQALFSNHRDQIAHLAVEIARVVLMQKVLEGAYDIEAIVKESLTHAPTRENLTIRVNPEDLADCCAAQSGKAGEAFEGVQFVGDHGVGRAECVVESPRGIVQ
ncbi:MAG: hypothetical protein HQ515_08035, partial [Phycisphaeraceae bacterium]|nr:hypothetical protein [Phycisphaeraceae bacterium]